jgi:hypothetical protein
MSVVARSCWARVSARPRTWSNVQTVPFQADDGRLPAGVGEEALQETVGHHRSRAVVAVRVWAPASWRPRAATSAWREMVRASRQQPSRPPARWIAAASAASNSVRHACSAA